MPNYNGERFIGASIESVLGQTSPDFELIVVDDASTDGSADVAKGYSGKDSRVRVIRGDRRGGSAAARNRGIRASAGDELCFLDSDDVYSPRNLEVQLGAIEQAGETVVSYCDWWRIDEGGNSLGPSRRPHPTKSGRIFSDAMAQTYGGIPMCMIPRACFDRVGLFDEALLWAEDLDLLLRLAREFDFIYTGQALYGYRTHEGSKRMTVGRRERLHYVATVLERHFLENRALVERGARERVISNLTRYYALTGQRRKMLRYGLSSWSGLREMLSALSRGKKASG